MTGTFSPGRTQEFGSGLDVFKGDVFFGNLTEAEPSVRRRAVYRAQGPTSARIAEVRQCGCRASSMTWPKAQDECGDGGGGFG